MMYVGSMLSAGIDHVEFQITGSYFDYHTIHALNVWHFSECRERAEAASQLVMKHSHSPLVFRSGLAKS